MKSNGSLRCCLKRSVNINQWRRMIGHVWCKKQYGTLSFHWPSPFIGSNVVNWPILSSKKVFFWIYLRQLKSSMHGSRLTCPTNKKTLTENSDESTIETGMAWNAYEFSIGKFLFLLEKSKSTYIWKNVGLSSTRVTAINRRNSSFINRTI